jgi:hypothetical protein
MTEVPVMIADSAACVAGFYRPFRLADLESGRCRGGQAGCREWSGWASWPPRGGRARSVRGLLLLRPLLPGDSGEAAGTRQFRSGGTIGGHRAPVQ